jgi:diguanylate cyclase
VTANLLAPRRWASTLTFRIVLLATLTGLLSAAGTAYVVLQRVETSIERVILSSAREDRERSASMLGSKTTVLRDALSAVANRVPEPAWRNGADMGRFLFDKPALGTLFSSVFAADPEGNIIARIEGGKLSYELPNVADRDYFKRAMSGDQPVISQAILGKVLKAPIVVIAIPALDREGRHLGVVGGSLALQSTAMFDELRARAQDGDVQDMVVDRHGRLLAHVDPKRLLQRADQEPGLQQIIQDWMAVGSPIETEARAMVQGDYVVSLAGIPLTDWLHIRVADAKRAMAPVADARAAALPAALVAGLVAGLAAGILGYTIARPISRLRARAESLLEDRDNSAHWPEGAGEVGQLAHAFRHVVEQRERRQTEAQALLRQLEAVLDHADVGIALTRAGHFELVSRQFCHIFRCEKQDAVGQSTRLIYPSDQAFEALVATARPALTEHGVLDTEVELIRRSGQVFWARMRGRAVVPGDISAGTIWTIEDVTAAKEQRERMAYVASHDSLTGLLNRAAFERLLDAVTPTAVEEPFCALFIDLDRFKHVNDTGGHAAGDALLRDIAQELSQQVRKTDSVARLGGDEFAVLLPSCPVDHARVIADKLCQAVQSFELLWDGNRFSVGASVGLVSVDGGFATAADVLRAADAACYAAKKRGRSRVEQFRSSGFLAPSNA